MLATIRRTIVHVAGPIEVGKKRGQIIREDIRCLRCDKVLWTRVGDDDEPWPLGSAVLQVDDCSDYAGTLLSDGPAGGRERKAAEVVCIP